MNKAIAIVPLLLLSLGGIALANALVMRAAATKPTPQMCDVGPGIERYAYWAESFTYRLDVLPRNLR